MALEYLNDEAESLVEPDMYLYRILTLDRFIDYSRNKLTFISPSKWSDPYEKVFLEAKYHYENEEFDHPLRHNDDGYKLFAQCWTGTKQTEAMWRGFAPNSDGVLLKIAGSVLVDILNEISERGSFNFFIGKVNYEDSDQLYQMKTLQPVWDDIRDSVVSQRSLSLLLKKRQAFSFEDEYRILAVKSNGRNSKGIAEFTVPNLVNRLNYIKFDPRMGEKLFEFTKDSLAMQFPEINIHKSRLYSNPVKKLHFGRRRPPEVNDELVWK